MLAGSGLTRQPAGTMKTSPWVIQLQRQQNIKKWLGTVHYNKQHFHRSYMFTHQTLSCSILPSSTASFLLSKNKKGCKNKQGRSFMQLLCFLLSCGHEGIAILGNENHIFSIILKTSVILLDRICFLSLWSCRTGLPKLFPSIGLVCPQPSSQNPASKRGNNNTQRSS